MARKHDKFFYSYGYKTAPEQWHFYWNNTLIQLENDVKTQIACLMLQGKQIEAEAILKRLLRKQEKEESYICIGFYGENSNQYYFTTQLKCRSNNIQEKLYAYKQWKRYIKESDCSLLTHTVTSEYVRPDGTTTKGITKKTRNRINLKKPVTIHIIKSKENKIFQF